MVGMVENGLKLLEIAGMTGNGWKWLKIAEITGMAGNGWKWLEIAQNGYWFLPFVLNVT